METQEFDLPSLPEAVQCQIYNEWTVNNTGIGPKCRLIIQSPTGAAYYIDYPTYSKYYHEPNEGTPEKEIGVRIYDMLHHIIVSKNNTQLESWTMSVPIKYMELVRDYGKPIDMPKPAWMESWQELQKAINNTMDEWIDYIA